MADNKKKMGGMKLGNFSGIKSEPEESTPAVTDISAQKVPKVSKVKESLPQEKLIAINIKITRSQHEWLNDIARTVRDNNTTPVPPTDRVYPQHLVAAAIDLLRESDIDWKQVKNINDLKQQLGIK
jgi:hypothetical protein